MQTNYALELKVARRRSGLSQHEIAHLVGISRSRVSKLECEIARPTPDELTTLSLIYSNRFLTMRGAVMPTIHANLQQRLNALPNKDSYASGTTTKADALNSLIERLEAKRKFRLDNVLSIAAASIKVGHVFLIDQTPYDWGSSRDASDSPRQAYDYATKKIKYYRPELIVTELITDKSKKANTPAP